MPPFEDRSRSHTWNHFRLLPCDSWFDQPSLFDHPLHPFVFFFHRSGYFLRRNWFICSNLRYRRFQTYSFILFLNKCQRWISKQYVAVIAKEIEIHVDGETNIVTFVKKLCIFFILGILGRDKNRVEIFYTIERGPLKMIMQSEAGQFASGSYLAGGKATRITG